MLLDQHGNEIKDIPEPDPGPTIGFLPAKGALVVADMFKQEYNEDNKTLTVYNAVWCKACDSFDTIAVVGTEAKGLKKYSRDNVMSVHCNTCGHQYQKKNFKQPRVKSEEEEAADKLIEWFRNYGGEQDFEKMKIKEGVYVLRKPLLFGKDNQRTMEMKVEFTIGKRDYY